MAMLICEVCGKEVKLTAPGVMVYVEAWVCTRGSGAGGGYHGISDSTELGRYRHKSCHKHGNIGTLFDSTSQFS